MSTPGFWEIVFLVVLALLIFGPDKLPGMARTAGRTISQIKREASSSFEELKRATDYEEVRGVAGELRATGAELKKATALPAATERRRGGDGVRRDTPAPFDPDAT